MASVRRDKYVISRNEERADPERGAFWPHVNDLRTFSHIVENVGFMRLLSRISQGAIS